jgi:hypothetical protein
MTSMSSRLSKPLTPLTAYLATLAILFGPVASFGSCCCSRAAAAAAETASVEAQESSCCSSVARPTGSHVGTGSCCGGSSDCSGSSDAACTEPLALVKGPCHCDETCCDARVPDTLAILGSTADQRELPNDSVPLLGILDAPCWHPASVVIAPQREPLTLSAQAHCALLCRWLN